MKLRNKKTGEIKEWQRVGAIVYGEMNEVYDAAEYNSLAELNEEWEDYIEPYIKDDKIRKAIRAWAEVNKIEDDEKVTYQGLYWKLYYQKVGQASIQFNVPLRIADGSYSIEELCGEEEE